MQTILMKATGRSSKTPIVILTGLNIGAKSGTFRTQLSHALYAARCWIKCYCTPRSFFRAIFSREATMAVAAIAISAMWLHFVIISDPIAAGEAVATDCLYAMPWGIVWAIRATKVLIKKGGEA